MMTEEMDDFDFTLTAAIFHCLYIWGNLARADK